jgi:hypothetical protein
MTIAMPFFMTSASFFVKLSITHFYTVLFPTPRLLARLCRLQLLLLTLCYLAGVIPIFVGCRPLAYTWDRTIPGVQCFDMKNFWMGTSIVAMFFDVTCVVLPIPVLWRLKLERGKKVRLVAVFGLGFLYVLSYSLLSLLCQFLFTPLRHTPTGRILFPSFSGLHARLTLARGTQNQALTYTHHSICALSAARIYVHKQVDFADLTYTAAPAMMLTVPEPSLGLVAGCLPIMVPLFAKFARAPSVIVASLSPGWKAGGSGGSASRAGGMGKGSATGTGRTKSTMSVSWLSSKSKSQSASRSCTLPSMRFGDSVDVDMEMMPEYSTTRVVVSRCGDRDEDMVGMFPEPLRATEEMMRELGGRSHWEGITVLREVHVKRGQQWNRSEV